jgi:hypothetical protein
VDFLVGGVEIMAKALERKIELMEQGYSEEETYDTA